MMSLFGPRRIESGGGILGQTLAGGNHLRTENAEQEAIRGFLVA
ncbi:hypothetical protein [Sorangium sp. So ce1389]